MFRWVQKKFSRKLSLSLSFLLALAMLCTGFFLTQALRQHWIAEFTSNLQTEARLVASQLNPSLFEEPPETSELHDRAAVLSRAGGCQVSFIRSDGVVLGDSRFDRSTLVELDNFKARAEVRRALGGEEGSSVRFSLEGDEQMLYATVPFPDGDDVQGVVRFAYPMAQVNQRIQPIQESILLMVFLILLGGIAVSFWLSSSLSEPIDDLVAVAGRLAQGDYDAKLLDLPLDELGELGRTLNLLAFRVRVNVTELSKEKAQLSAILSNMVEAVGAVNQNGQVIAINPTMARLFKVDLDQIMGLRLIEILRNSQLEDLVRKTLSDGQPHMEEVQILTFEEQIFEAAVAPLVQDGQPVGALLVLHDITRIRRLEQVRKDFVANVSHELRTPLAAITGYAETLKSGTDDKKTTHEFLDIIRKHAHRMEALVEDLLELSAIESGQKEWMREPLSILALAEEVAKSLKSLARQKKISVQVQKESGLPMVQADRNQMKQVLTNLIQNAIKFNKANGTVTVSANLKEEFLHVSVKDSGIGVPEGDIPRLFERFYRVDKARSREMGGTGLGLAIVKHIIEAHKGKVFVVSRENQGSTFVFTLPLSS